MKKMIMLLVFGMLIVSMISFAFAASNNSKNGSQNQEQNQISDANQNQGQLNQSQVKNVVRDRNRLRINASSSNCPEKCTCSGNTTKCQLQGEREMTIQAGNSGNTIVQVKGIQAQTKVQLYKTDEKLYGVFTGNQTRRILSPEQVEEKVREKLQLRNCSCENMTLNEDGTYEVQAQKQSRLFGIFKVREKLRLKYNAGNGDLIRDQTSWWGFLAADEKQEQLLGSSCGTVTPGQNDACCQNKGYDKYNLNKGECIFSE
jgi:hypothetical protein